jgi:hypothetical protein
MRSRETALAEDEVLAGNKWIMGVRITRNKTM